MVINPTIFNFPLDIHTMKQRDCPHGRQLGKCSDCEVIELTGHIRELHEFLTRYRYRVEVRGLESPKFIDDLLLRTRI